MNRFLDEQDELDNEEGLLEDEDEDDDEDIDMNQFNASLSEAGSEEEEEEADLFEPDKKLEKKITKTKDKRQDNEVEEDIFNQHREETK